MCQGLFFNKIAGLRNTSFIEHLWAAASVYIIKITKLMSFERHRISCHHVTVASEIRPIIPYIRCLIQNYTTVSGESMKIDLSKKHWQTLLKLNVG